MSGDLQDFSVAERSSRASRGRRRLGTALVTGSLAGALLWGLATPAPAAKRRCNRPAQSNLLASNAVASVWAVDANEDPEYGGPVSVFACLKSRPARRRTLTSYGTGEAVTFTRVRLQGGRISWHETVTDVACSKYGGSGCSQERDAAYSVRTGRPLL
jgi:hypothetical protein